MHDFFIEPIYNLCISMSYVGKYALHKELSEQFFLAISRLAKLTNVLESIGVSSCDFFPRIGFLFIEYLLGSEFCFESPVRRFLRGKPRIGTPG